MDKKVIFAVAGSGKTTHIINNLSLGKRALVLTYTDNNYEHLKNKVIEKFRHMPDCISIQKFFSFLYSFAYRPFLHYKYRAKGINWESPSRQRANASEVAYYRDKYHRLYSNRIARLVRHEDIISDIINRLEKYYDYFFIDEIQDIASHDFNLLIDLCKANLDMCFVGDFYQHTFDTSRDGNVNNKLHDNYDDYKDRFSKERFIIDEKTLSKSYRCHPKICQFVTDSLGINMDSNKTDNYNVYFEEDEGKAAQIFNNDDIVKLFYKEHAKYSCYSNNWGNSKGLDDYGDVCVVLNATTFRKYKSEKLDDLTPRTKNKLYVACTRANKSLYLVDESFYKKFRN